jgi:hypothetical protein
LISGDRFLALALVVELGTAAVRDQRLRAARQDDDDLHSRLDFVMVRPDRFPHLAVPARLILRFIRPSERPPVQCPGSVLEHIGAVDHAAFAFSLLAVDFAVLMLKREFEQ